VPNWGSETDRKELAGIVQNAKPEASVKRLCGHVVMSCLDMESQNVPSSALSE
jgi:hypothetical protein